MKYFYCDFDSNIFKRKWYRLDLSDEKSVDMDKIKKTILDSDADYVDLKLSMDKVYLERKLKGELKFRKICTHVAFRCDLDEQELKAENFDTYQNLLSTNTINAIAKKCSSIFTTSRFSLDELLEENLVLNFFYEWIKKSLSNDSYVKFVHKNSFCVLKRSECDNDMVVDLIGVPKEAQGRGIGSKLLLDAMNYSKKEKCNRIFATTEVENPSAFRLYSKNGFKIDCFSSSFHLRVNDLKLRK